MSNEKYLGEIEFLRAAACMRKKLEQASSLEEAIPFRADASYTNEESVMVPAAVTIETYKGKKRPGPSYYLQLEAKLADYGFEQILITGTKDEMLAWLDQWIDPEKTAKFLFDSYRGVWESVDSVRFRDY